MGCTACEAKQKAAKLAQQLRLRKNRGVNTQSTSKTYTDEVKKRGFK